MPVNTLSRAQRLNNHFDDLLRENGIILRREFRACPPRRFAWDFALPEIRLLIEVQGGIWIHGKTAHTSGEGIRRDARKNNLAVQQGWRVIYITSDMIEKKHGREALDIVIATLEALS